MDIFNFKRTGVIKAWIDTFFWWFARVSQLIVILGFLKYLTGYGWMMVAIIIPAIILVILFIVYLHMKYVYGSEKKFASEVNPIVMEILANTRQIKSKVNGKDQ